MMNSHLADELANKVKVLTTALNKAEDIISVLEKENNRLVTILIGLTSDNSTDAVLDSEAICT